MSSYADLLRLHTVICKMQATIVSALTEVMVGAQWKQDVTTNIQHLA